MIDLSKRWEEAVTTNKCREFADASVNEINDFYAAQKQFYEKDKVAGLVWLVTSSVLVVVFSLLLKYGVVNQSPCGMPTVSVLPILISVILWCVLSKWRGSNPDFIYGKFLEKQYEEMTKSYEVNLEDPGVILFTKLIGHDFDKKIDVVQKAKKYIFAR